MEKSANKRWKESGTTLTFKEWIDRENKKGNSPIEQNFLQFDAKKEKQEMASNLKSFLSDSEDNSTATPPPNNTIFGLNKGILIFSTALIVGSLSYLAYKKIKKK